MKNESAYVKKLTTLLKKMPAPADPPPQRDPVTQLIIGFLQWDATRRQAELAFKRLMDVMVDNNDLRVSHPHQVLELVGEHYPRVHERIARMRDAMQEIYVREHAITPNSLTDKAKKDIRTYYDTLPGMTPYVAAMVMLFCYGAHAIPVDDKLANQLKEEGVVDAHATAEEISHFLERYFKAGEGIDAYLRLQAWSDEVLKRPAKPPAKKSAPRKRKGTKKVVKHK